MSRWRPDARERLKLAAHELFAEQGFAATTVPEITARAVQIALNGGTITASGTGATSIDKFEPLAFGVTETRVMIGWQSDPGDERWVWRRCLQTGTVAIARQRGAAKGTIPVNFSLETPSGGAKPFMSITKSTATIT